MRITFFLILGAVFLSLVATSQVTPSSAQERLSAFDKRQTMSNNSPFSGIEFRSVGPSIMSGRVVDIEVDPADETHFYVAYASGGLWESKNNGQSFEPLFDSEMVMTIGNIDVDWSNGRLWIGSGEVNSSRSSYAGMGVFSSDDNGKTWQHKGLEDTHHIGAIEVHPSDPNTLWVASLGHLYSEVGQAGVFVSHDNGATWSHTLNIAGAGAVDLVVHPRDPKILYAAMWERSRSAWNFKGNGINSGVYESRDGGENWTSITTSQSGFPEGEGVGRIGLALAEDKGTPYLYAFHDNQEHRQKEKEETREIEFVKADFEFMSKESFLAAPQKDIEAFLTKNKFPDDIDYYEIKKRITQDEISPKALFDFLFDANSNLFDTPVIGAEVWKFDFEKSTWAKTHEGHLDNVVYSYGYYFGTIAVNPSNPEELYIAGVPILHSIDGGKTWEGINNENVHVDHHKIWVNPNRSGHLINGNDGGINISYDNGRHYMKCNSPSVGQFYTVNVDYETPYNIYGGLQDNGVWKGPSTHKENDAWHQRGQYPWEMVMGGDGMQVEIDGRDGTIYTGYQFGHYYRITDSESQYFHPSHELGERPLRWNWQTPILLSTHNRDILYMCSNKVHRSMDQGKTWRAISDDLTHGGKSGNVPYGTITAMHESTSQFGKLLVGTDDGKVHITLDGGVSWKDISAGLPDNLWLSRVQFSAHSEDRIFVALNGYRMDDCTAYAFQSDDNGNTWKSISAGLPNEAINVLKEDRKNENIIYVGTDHGLYVSINQGRSFDILNNGLPAVSVHDLVVQEREKDLVVATHGRSIYVADIDLIRTMAQSKELLYVSTRDSVRLKQSLGQRSWFASGGTVSQELSISGFKRVKGPAELTVLSEGGTIVWSASLPSVEMGSFITSFDLMLNEDNASKLEREIRKTTKNSSFEIQKTEDGGHMIPAGTYIVELSSGSRKSITQVVLH